MTRLGYQIPNFNYPDVGPDGLFEAVAAQARAADQSGFDTVFVMDHFYQLPGIGDPDDYMLECYTLLAALARETEQVRLSALVTGNTYRNPAVLAKTVTTVDLVSNGRAMLAIGSGWFELEHDAFGIEFNTFTERFEKLEEALQIILPMLRDERPSLDGTHYQVADAINQPAPISDIPVMIGGNGEKKTLRMVAQYATDGNLTCERNEIPQKVEALAGHCERLGRDRSEITLSHLTRVLVAPTMAEAEADLHDFLVSRGNDPSSMTDDELDFFKAIFIFGDADSLAEAMEEEMALGIEGFTFNAVANGHKPERVEFLGEAAKGVLG
ncbi:MAG TPA: LLM class F420-dependent oxidoreductase [Acidimicrobiales bacterium]|nr:LLM class F420-dependent oxidoreductase [Acidimicrobiales bacterium]